MKTIHHRDTEAQRKANPKPEFDLVFSVPLMELLAIRLGLAKAPAKSLVMCLCGELFLEVV